MELDCRGSLLAKTFHTTNCRKAAMKNQWRRRLATAALGVVGMFGVLAPASAVIVTTRYDPSFAPGSPLDGYGWTGTINYEIPAQCFNSGTHITVNLAGLVVGCGAPIVADFKVLSAQVGIYQNGNPNFLLDVLTFSPSSLPLFAMLVTAPNNLSNIVSASLTDLNFVSNQVGGSKAFDLNFLFRLRMDGSTEPDLQYKCLVVTTNCSDWTAAPAPTTTTFTRQDGKTFDQVFAVTELQVGQVPEPGSVALVLLALGAAFATTRRHRFFVGAVAPAQ